MALCHHPRFNLGFCNSWITIPPSSPPKQPAIVEHRAMASDSGYFGLIALFFVPGFLIGIIAIILGLTQTMIHSCSHPIDTGL